MPITVPKHTIKTPIGGHTLELKDYITGFDSEAIQSLFTDQEFDFDIKKSEEGKPIDALSSIKISGKVIQDAEHEGVKRVVISVNGDNKNVLNDVYNMHSDDTKYVVEMVRHITDPEDDSSPKGKKPNENTHDS